MEGTLNPPPSFFTKIKKVGTDDPRRITHSFKVALGLTLVSAFYYINPTFNDLGGSAAMWAVLTVVLVMEFTVGAAVSKALNRACATFLAGALGVAAHHFAILFGERGEPIVLAASVFFVASAATFARFAPEIKARFDYGVTIFILTFCLVTVSSYRRNDVLVLARERVITIGIGVLIAFSTSILVFPVWAGGDLHCLIACDLERLADFSKSFGEVLEGKNSNLQGHKTVLNSKSAEDSLSNFARFEPPHGRFGLRHPWDQYLKLGAQSRRCAYHMEALSTYMVSSNQVGFEKGLRIMCAELSSKTGKALSDMSSAMRSMAVPSAAAKERVAIAGLAAEQLKTCLLEMGGGDIEGMVCGATIVFLLTEITGCVHEIMGSVEELGRLAGFRSGELYRKAAVVEAVPVNVVEGPHVCIEILEGLDATSN